MYENVKNHPAFIAFSATPTSVADTGVQAEAEKDKVDEKAEIAAE